MSKQFIGLTVAASVLLAGVVGEAQSAYFQAVTNLSPVVYFPLQELIQPPIGDVETNQGSLGTSGNAVYSAAAASKGAGGAIADGDAAVSFSDAAGGFLAVPTTDPRTAVQSQKFTVEVWVNSAENARNFEGIVAKAGGNNAGINGANNIAGWCLSQNYIAYLDSSNLRGFDFHVYCGVGHEGAEVIVPFNVVNNTWYHVVATFDGSNCRLFINGVDMVAVGSGYQIPMTGSYVPDTWNPLQIGSSRNLNANNYHGVLDEVAIYTNVLSTPRIQAHYTAASGSGYAAAVALDTPYMYWRMDSPGYVAPDPGTYPVAAAYGLNATSFAATYATASQPGVSGPQFPGLLDPNNGNSSYAVAINGIGGNNGNTANVVIQTNFSTGATVAVADAAPMVITPLDNNSVLLNPTNHSPFSAVVWFKSNPMDYSRYQNIFGHSDSGWRAGINNPAGTISFKPGNAGAQLASDYSFSDGTWHHLVCTFDGTNVENMFVDGRLSATSSGNNVTETGSPYDVILGGDPQYLSAGNATYTGGASGYAQRNLSGSIAHFAFFTNALTAAQVMYLYTNAVPNQAPYIISQPASGRVNPPPASVFFGVVAGSSGGLGYQWYFNTSSNYSGATRLANDSVKYTLVTTSQMTISNLVAGDSGYYFVIITNSSGSVTSSLASLSINYAPVITAQSPAADFSLFPSQQATLSVSAITESNLVYQWYAGGTAVPNGTNAQYVSAPVTAAGTSFYCIVTNMFGSATSMTVSVSALLPLPATLTNSPFGSNILALAPTAYWPMHEIGETPTTVDCETNYGSLGSAGNANFGDWRNVELAAMGVVVGGNENAPTNVSVLHGLPGAITGDPDPAINFAGANNSWIAVPRTSPQTAIRAPFTIEGWVRPNDSTYGIMVAEDSGTLNTNTARGGFDWQYSGTANAFSISIYNGNGASGHEPKTAAIYPPGQWYHVVTTFDGTNVQYFINGVADAMTGGNGSNATLYVNTWDPITIGCGRGLNNTEFRGSLDEVAIYTNILSVAEIQKHYNDGTNPAYANYKSDVLADKPLLYYRMDSPIFTPPPISVWPVLTNYGAVAVNGVYTPGAVPGGGVGPSDAGIPVAGLSASTSLACDGNSIFADAGNVPQFTPTGKTPFSVAAWIKGNPADSSRGWQSIVGHGDSAWRLVLDGTGVTANGNGNFNAGPGGGSDIGNATTALTVNDGDWHWLLGTFDGTNSTVYVDGVLSATAANATANITGQSIDLFLGGYPNNTGVNTNTARTVANEVGRGFAGNMCEAAFWNGQALTPAQISSVYQSVHVAAHILRQPLPGATVNQNVGYTNNALVAAGPELVYQWYENGTAYPGQTNAALMLAATKASDASTNWYCVVTNNYGSATSAPVALIINSMPSFTQNLTTTNITLYAGGHTAFAVAAVGAVPLSYQWYSNSVAIPGATNAGLTLNNVQPANSTSTYFCTVTNVAGATNSFLAIVKVIANPAVIPYSQLITAQNPVGFWPLSEPDESGNTGGGATGPNNGVIAHDYWAGNNGNYTNVTLAQPGFNPTIDPNATSGEFGANSLVNGDVINIPTSVDFGASNSSSFTIEAWVMGYQQGADAGIVSKGYNGSEQFSLDCGSDTISQANPVAHSYRFLVRDASGTAHVVNSSVNPDDGLWHYLVGVCDESSNAVVTFYIDGLPVGTAPIATNSGVLASARSMIIGSRPSSTTLNQNDWQFVGWIQDVAVFNKALSPATVLEDYEAADIPATVAIQPTNMIVGQFGTVSTTAGVIGTPVVGFQWFDQGNGGNAMAGQTNATLTLTNVQNSDSYYLQVTNAFGTNVSTTVSVTVVSGAPQIYVQPPTSIFVPVGGSVSLPVTAYGDEPLAFQWRVSDTNGVSWTNMSDTTRITGCLSNVLTIANVQLSDGVDYQLLITNESGSVMSSVVVVTVGSLPISFNGNAAGWTTNNSARVTGDNVVSLTDPNNGGGIGTIWFNYPQYIGGFKAAFTYQDVGGNGADGFTFCLQNDPRGPTAWSAGSGGSNLGVVGVTPSFELEYNIYSGFPQGYCVETNGIIGTFIPPAPVNFDLGNPINVTVTYANGRMALTFVDSVLGTTFSTNLNVGDLTQILQAQTAYVGFTGSCGGVTAHQTISNFSYVSWPAETMLVVGTNAVLSWPGYAAGYVLQENGDLATTNWVDVTNQSNVTNAQYQVTVPVGGSNTFYRLRLQP